MWLLERIRWVLAAVVVVGLGAAIYLTQSTSATGGQKTTMAASHHMASHHMAKKMAPPAPSQLMQTLSGVTKSDYARGYLPMSSCHQMGAAEVMCEHPYYAISEVVFRKYPSLPSLYAAYVARVKALAGGRFRTNFGDCNPGTENGERSWNHHFKHPKIYRLAPFVSGKIHDAQAVGRLYCTLSGGVFYTVWTQNDGRLLNEVAGSPHYDTYQWWLHVHHSIPVPGMPSMMANMGG